MTKIKYPEPMTLLNKLNDKHEKDIYQLRLFGMSITPPKPIVAKDKVEAAASAMAAWDNSDPFVAARTRLYVRQGYLSAASVIAEFTKRQKAREAAARQRPKADVGDHTPIRGADVTELANVIQHLLSYDEKKE